jgi:hypothetical protein
LRVGITILEMPLLGKKGIVGQGTSGHQISRGSEFSKTNEFADLARLVPEAIGSGLDTGFPGHAPCGWGSNPGR